MNADYTQQQSVGEQMRAEELSRRTTVPPAEVPGYKLEKLLGQGAFGQVWVGRNLNTGRQVAVKFYLHRGGVNWSQLSREVKNLVSMSTNRFVVQVLEVGWEAEPPFYVMEFLENGSLDDLIRAQGALPIEQAVQMFVGIARGLNVSHGKGVLHCDLKPANVLLDQDLQPRLADFGQSRLSDEQTPSLGTLFYMAPEQADLNAMPDARWDVYALGAILHCLLVGTPPYRTPEMVMTLDTAANLPDRLQRYRNSILKSPTPRAHYRVSGVDRPLTQIVDRCLAKNPDDRFSNVQMVLEALQERHSSRLRRPLMLLGIVGPLMLLIVMGLFAWRGISVATGESTQELRSWALRSNSFAAKFAARTLETEFASLFRLLEEESRRESFEGHVQQCLNSAGKEMLDDLAQAKPRPGVRTAFLGLAEQDELEEFLKTRFSKLQSDTNSKKSARFDSLFVVDRRGTIIASAFDSDTNKTTAGKNFAYRSYFNGRREDLPSDVDRRKIGPIRDAHVSAPFQSTETNRWKIGVCLPIRLTETDAIDRSEAVDGVIVLTINLGDFELLAQSRPSGTPTRFAALVDGHIGKREGTLLQHPVLRRLDEQLEMNADVKDQQFQIDSKQMNALKTRGLFDFQDPTAQSALGIDFSGDWISAMERVRVRRRAGQLTDGYDPAENTDLWVLVQERAENIAAPVDTLERKLMHLGWFALAILLAVIVVLWGVVFRALQMPENAKSLLSSWLGYDTMAESVPSESTIVQD
jgi:serine/threonine protein kinase